MTVQAVDRALLVDTLSSSEQAAGNAWAARMLGVGSVVGFFVYVLPLSSAQAFLIKSFRGNIDLTRLLPFLGKTQLEALSVVVSLLLLGCHLLTAGSVKEKILLKSPSSDGWVLSES